MKRALAVLATASSLALAAASAPAVAGVPASQPHAGITGVRAQPPAARATAHPSSLMGTWSRETVRPGAKDVSPSDIEHVRELQYRLRWVGLYPIQPTGTFGGMTEYGVKQFQARRHLPVTGSANGMTWKLLLERTVRRPTAIPAVCKTGGWHVCYDRTMHQVTLWLNGSIYNTWLVRGGGVTTQTRLGTHQVFYRDIDHVSGIYGTPMPYAQFFDGGEAVHGSVLMMDPFVDHSHGCINMYIEDARQLWNLTHDKTLWVTVYGAWS